jgi:hypothetical protein
VGGGPVTTKQHQWEQLDSADEYDDGGYSNVYTHRMRVPGGWLYRVSNGHDQAVTFVPSAKGRKQ